MIRIDAFDLVEPLGKGAAGSVWRGIHRPTGEQVAVKVAHHTDPRWARLFADEVRALAAIDSPYVVRIDAQGVAREGSGLEVGSPWLAMELADGSLQDGIRSWSEAREALAQTLLGLRAVHARGIVHRDLKPANILRFDYREGARYKLADFGIAVASGQATQAPGAAGTPAYMAPEQIWGGPADLGPATDLYATGCIAWQLVTGQTPFVGPARRVLMAHMGKPPPELVPRMALVPGVEAWIRRLLQKDPEARFTRAVQALEGLLLLGEVADPAPGRIALENAETWREFEVAAVSSPIRNALSTGPFALPPNPPEEPPPRAVRAGAGADLFGVRTVPLTARKAECEALWSALHHVHTSGRAAGLILRGAPGVGVTRLARWLCERSHEAGAVEVLWVPIGQDLRLFVARELGIDGMTAAQARERLVPWLESCGQSASVADRIQRFTELQTVDAEDRAAILGVLLTLKARSRTAVVVLDDASPEGLDWMAAALKRSDLPVPTLFLATVRLPESELVRDHIARAEAAGARVVEIGELTAADVTLLIQDHLRLAGPIAGVVQRQVGGNVGRAIALVAEWIRRRVLQAGASGFEVVGTPTPESPVQDPWAEGLHALLKEMGDPSSLAVAALVGPWVEDAEWEACCEAVGIEPDWTALDALARARFVQRRPGGWAFGSSAAARVLQHVVGPRWQALAASCASALHARGASLQRVGSVYLEAGDDQSASAPLLEAAGRLRDAGRNSEAMAVLDLWEAAQARLTLDASDPSWGEAGRLKYLLDHERRPRQAIEQILALIERARVYGWPSLPLLLAEGARQLRSQDPQASRALIEEALRLSPEPHDRARMLVARARAVRETSLDAALADVAEAQELLAGTRGTMAWLSAQHIHADLLVGRDPARARERLSTAIAEVPPHEVPLLWRFEAEVLLGLASRNLGENAVARVHFGLALELVRQTGSPSREATVCNYIAEIDRWMGDLDAAEAGYQRCVELNRRVGRSGGLILVNLGLVAILRGDDARAYELIWPTYADFHSKGREAWTAALAPLVLPLIATDAARFEAVLKTAQEMLERTGVGERDAVWTAELAAERVADPALKQSALALAQAHRALLGGVLGPAT